MDAKPTIFLKIDHQEEDGTFEIVLAHDVIDTVYEKLKEFRETLPSEDQKYALDSIFAEYWGSDPYENIWGELLTFALEDEKEIIMQTLAE